jgi:hypothetical protein
MSRALADPHALPCVWGLQVMDLHRVEVMGITLDGLPREGVWQDLDAREMEYVRKAIAGAAENTSVPQRGDGWGAGA